MNALIVNADHEDSFRGQTIGVRGVSVEVLALACVSALVPPYEFRKNRKEKK